MLPQQIIAIILILIIFSRIVVRFRRKEISKKEFGIWTVFWLLALGVVLFLRQVDAFVRSIGIVGRGIDVIVYVSIALIFYLIFRIIVRLDKIEREITRVVRKVALDEADKK
ncbi:DUF2304 family protein [Patescibacteria group bacterium]|nr:DUF2304 family protein [Patescibacteria group bacterium]MBU4512440.1 DUF2304 family protein [Patescibacteria group bacterium]MCG2692568.1 DUF2304 family protein [Candidatus Parcubacteria bacterium]